MSIASEITRLQGVKSDILTAISDKGVTVPAGSALDDCPGLIADIPSGPNYKVIGGKEYRTVVMPDGKEWFAENLDFKFCKVGGALGVAAPNAWYYNNSETTYGWDGYKCGLLYNFYAVDFLNSYRDDLIPGWHVPSSTEWDDLFTAIGGASTASTKLKALDNSISSDWPSSWGGTDDYGFSAVPGGRITSTFENLGTNTNFWTSTQYDSNKSYRINLGVGAAAEILSSGQLAWGLSIRLVKD